ncbi:MAG: P1 family peptidase [Vulcanimicrobiaceae bacterium]
MQSRYFWAHFRVVPALVLALVAGPALASPALAVLPIRVGVYTPGPLDGITDVPGVRVANLTLIAGTDVRTGATAILPNADPWDRKVAAATFILNGNGEMTGTHWINEAGYLEEPIVLTDTMDVGLADNGVISWVEQHEPHVGLTDDVPLPVVAECDDQLLNDIRGRHVRSADIVKLLNSEETGQFARGSVGAGTGMRAFDFKGGIGSASRVISRRDGGYTVGVLVNDNTGSTRRQLVIDGVPVGRLLGNVDRTTFPHPTALRGRMASGSIIVVVATNAPLDSRQLHALAKRAALGMARTGLTSDVGSGDLFIAFSTGYVYRHIAPFRVKAPARATLEADRKLNSLYRATAEATQAAIYDALFEATTITGRGGVTVHALPKRRVEALLARVRAVERR